MANFDNILAGIHGEGIQVETQDSENTYPIEITTKRTFNIPKEFNTTIGYVGDVNSQVITFIIPRSHENHDLSLCNHKTIKWKNLASGIEGQDTLEIVPDDTNSQTITLTWSAKPELFTKAGFIEISISIYDIVNGKIAFSWNTPVYSRLEVGASSSSIATLIGNYRAPAQNEILYIDEETRQIVMPKNYNPIIANLGDVDTSVVFFQAPANIRGINLLDENIEVNVHVGANGSVWTERITNISAENANIASYNSLVNLLWFPSSGLTNNDDKYFGNITISISFEGNNKYWITSQLNSLKIGEAVVGSEELIPEEAGKQTIVDGNDWNDQLATRVVGGIIKLREHNELEDSAKGTGGKKIVEKIHDNELVTYYKKETIGDENIAVYVGLLLGHENIGTQSKEQGTIPADAICIPLRGELNLHNLYLAGESVARLKGFYWSSIQFNGDGSANITLSTKNGVFGNESTPNVALYWQKGDIISIEMDLRYENCSEITNIQDNIITVNHLPSNSLPSDAEDNKHIADRSVFVLSKPDAGLVDFGYYAFAFGDNNKALGYASAAFGRDNEAYGYYSFVGGRNNKVAYGSVSFGRNNTVDGQYASAFGDLHEVPGRNGSALGHKCFANDYGVAGGYETQAFGMCSVALGQSIAGGAYDATFGKGITWKSGENQYSFHFNTAFGEAQVQSGTYSTAFGKSIITGSYAFSAGLNTKATSSYAAAFGHTTTAGEYGAAFGYLTISGVAGLVQGQQSEALGYCSVAIGRFVKISDAASFSAGFGDGLEITTPNTTVIGKYNINNTDALFMVGNGSDSNTGRHNAFEVLKNNSIKIGDTIFTENELKRLKKFLESIKLDGEV